MVNPKKGRGSNINNTSLHHTSHLSKIIQDSSLTHYSQIWQREIRGVHYIRGSVTRQRRMCTFALLIT